MPTSGAEQIIPAWVETDTLAKQGSISFLKKETKTFALLGNAADESGAYAKRKKVFWFFFSKKNCFLGACLPLAVSGSQCGSASRRLSSASALE
jgi:hypothetical protein